MTSSFTLFNHNRLGWFLAWMATAALALHYFPALPVYHAHGGEYHVHSLGAYDHQHEHGHEHPHGHARAHEDHKELAGEQESVAAGGSRAGAREPMPSGAYFCSLSQQFTGTPAPLAHAFPPCRLNLPEAFVRKPGHEALPLPPVRGPPVPLPDPRRIAYETARRDAVAYPADGAGALHTGELH